MSKAFILSEFAQKVGRALGTHLADTPARDALQGVFLGLQHLAALTPSRLDGEFHDAVHEQLGEGQQKLSDFALGLLRKLEPKLPGWAVFLFRAVLLNLTTIARMTPTAVDDLVLTILDATLDLDESEGKFA